MTRETSSRDRFDSLAVGVPLEAAPSTGSDDAIQLESCPALELIVVTTRSSVYDVVVLSGHGGDVVIRGGRFFPEFRRAKLVGSTTGGSAVKLRNVRVGFHMELNVDGQRVVTSRIQRLSRRHSKFR